MPELPEVQTVVSRLDARLRGAVVESVRLLRRDVVKHGPRALEDALVRKKVQQIRRHGKRIIWELDPDTVFNVHLGMTGNLVLVSATSPLAPHTHLRVRFAGIDDELRFRDARRFGGVWLSDGRGDGRDGRFSRPLGPDALAIRLPQFRELLGRDRQIKALLMDQQTIAGMGNIYCDESLHRSRIHPLSAASRLTDEEIQRLLGSIRNVLRSAIRAGGSSLRDYRNADDQEGWFQIRHRVYGREGRPCRRCGATVRRIVVSSRSTWFCPTCQKRRRARRR
ncbi:MAG: bifunctional DNA-formamidopyrimidine glycosylase/DNA-(apurinic or apyrimidinic site) lyase [Acidobacteriota bacterium]|nr:bifunctional DNA-formamidopyrimidine glycosylase/DNA-(apurinic or apyrimidinic site) lyase [Acidobacteriota bacterium]